MTRSASRAACSTLPAYSSRVRAPLASSGETDGLFDEARERVCEALAGDDRRQPDVGYLVGKVRDTLNSFVYERTRRRPMILPLVTEV